MTTSAHEETRDRTSCASSGEPCASPSEMLAFYKAVVRSAVEYACVAWHTGLTARKSDRIESIQRRALRIIDPDLTYHQALQRTGLKTLEAQGEDG